MTRLRKKTQDYGGSVAEPPFLYYGGVNSTEIVQKMKEERT